LPNFVLIKVFPFHPKDEWVTVTLTDGTFGAFAFLASRRGAALKSFNIFSARKLDPL
jgi:hypothetical protein